jgi:hypothetical protein
MSDLLTHWAVCEDSLNLMPFDPEIEPILKKAVQREPHMARYGAIVRTEGHWVPLALREGRGVDADAIPEALARRLAFAAAALTHTACDRMMKPSYQRVIAEQEALGAVPTTLAAANLQRDVYAYQDTFVFQEVLGDGAGPALGRFMFADIDTQPVEDISAAAAATFCATLADLRPAYSDPSVLDRDTIVQLVRSTLNRMINEGDGAARTVGSRGLARHAFYEWAVDRKLASDLSGLNDDEGLFNEVAPLLTGARDEPLEQLDDYLCGMQWLYVYHHRLIDAYKRRDAAKTERYRIHPDFYDPKDPMIVLAAAVRQGAQIDADDLMSAMVEGANRSCYGQALAIALMYLRQAGEILRGEADDIDTPNYRDQAFVERMRAKSAGGIYD